LEYLKIGLANLSCLNTEFAIWSIGKVGTHDARTMNMFRLQSFLEQLLLYGSDTSELACEKLIVVLRLAEDAIRTGKVRKPENKLYLSSAVSLRP
jgi:hypothetical protein